MAQTILDPIEVVAGVIFRPGQILIAKRKPDQGIFTSGKWEFPGGKREETESKIEALRREMREELGVEIEIHRQIACVNHLYRNDQFQRHTRLTLFLCSSSGDPRCNVHEEILWVAPEEMMEFDMSPSDLGILPMVIEAVQNALRPSP